MQPDLYGLFRPTMQSASRAHNCASSKRPLLCPAQMILTSACCSVHIGGRTTFESPVDACTSSSRHKEGWCKEEDELLKA